MSFGKMPMANGFLDKKNFKKEFFYNLEVGFSKDNYLFQVNDHPKSPHIFNNNYPFYTSKSKYMVRHFKKYFEWVNKKFLNKKSNIIEIGSNDGSFLKNFKLKKINHLGFEPSKNVANFSRKNYGVKVFNGFFNKSNVKKFKKFKKNTDLICAANVICHIPDLKDVIHSIDYLLSRNGVFVFEEPYLGSMFKKVSYDQIYDAHVFIFSAHSVKTIFKSFKNSKPIIYSLGHRNGQGLFVKNELVLMTEHGPRGGDEINKITFNKNYGWPIASYGEKYSSNSEKNYYYKKSHKNYGYEEPIFSFIPSIGISELIYLPNSFSNKWIDNYLVTSLYGRSIYRIKFNEDFNKIIYMEKIFIDERIRDIKFFSKDNMVLLAFEEKGQLGILTNN